MSDRDALDATLADWRTRWPEWQIAELFVAPESRETSGTWFDLLGELARAAWGGSDPTPGLAKLGWWQEELRGWSRGMRRHPLGLALQKQPVDWSTFADTLGVLRERALADAEPQQAVTALQPFLSAIRDVERGLFGDSAHESEPAQVWRSLRVMAGLPLAVATLQRGGTRPRRIFDALAMARANAARKGDAIVVSRWRTLVLAWRAARDR